MERGEARERVDILTEPVAERDRVVVEGVGVAERRPPPQRLGLLRVGPLDAEDRVVRIEPLEEFSPAPALLKAHPVAERFVLQFPEEQRRDGRGARSRALQARRDEC